MIKYSEKLVEQLNKQIEAHFPMVHKITDQMTQSYESIARLVMLDRYAVKDFKLETLEVGDLVIVKIKHDPKYPTLGIGYVKTISQEEIKVEIEEDYRAQIDSALKPTSEGIISVERDIISKPLEIYYEQIAKRVGSHLAEDEEKKDLWTEEFVKELAELNVVPAGRVLAGAGAGLNITYFNCFVLPMPKDSRDGIANHRRQAMEIMARGGGVGTNGSTLRPKDAVAITVGGKSSGAVSWLNDLASLTDLVQQGGSRRGAQMIMLQDWHPDILEFIISKMQNPRILQYIAEHFKNPIIQRLAKEKLKFKPLTASEKAIFELVAKSSDDAKLVEEAKAKLELGGTYEVANPEFLTGANISVGITKDFMQAVEKNGTYQLKFPDIANMSKTQKEFYDGDWHNIGDVRVWEEMGYPVKVYNTIKARELWDLINFCATYSAEPGVFFIDTANEMTNAKAYGQKVVCTNPCGEQPLAPYSVCNLAAVNLANFINKETKEILWEKLKKTVSVAVRLQDNIIDKTPYFLEENRTQALGERRVGMGVMGLHDMLLWAGVRYGSKESIELIDKIFETMAVAAYTTSAHLAVEKGSFGFLSDKNALIETGYIKKLPKEVKTLIKEHGLRNSHLLTIAPTGSTGTMVGVSTGLEPYFAFKYFRSGRLGKFIQVDQKIVEEWKAINNFKGSDLPEFFVSAMEISPEEHVDVQCAIQRWIDSSISKTVNAPKGYTVEQVEKVYSRLYKCGAKGGTVYVDGSRDSQVLSISKEENKMDAKIEHKKHGPLVAEPHVTEITHNTPAPDEKKIGTDVGDTCPICKLGTVEDLGGCHSCSNCGAQVKCGL